MGIERMTPAAFKAEYRRKGWTGRSLAERWKKSEAWISKIGCDPEREPHWDDAVRGLPAADAKNPAKAVSTDLDSLRVT